MKIIGLVIIVVGLFVFFYSSIYQYWFRVTAINVGDCLFLPDATDCIQRKIDLAEKQPWWESRAIYFPPGNYNISGPILLKKQARIVGR